MVSCSIPAWIGRFLACLGGCFGCCTKPTPIIAVDEPSKGLRIQGFAVKNPGISDGFWSTSTCDLENSAVQSQRSISSTTISNQTLCQSSSVGSASNNSDFVNHAGMSTSYIGFSLLGILIGWNGCLLVTFSLNKVFFFGMKVGVIGLKVMAVLRVELYKAGSPD
ncbi:uncharacterized protein LOC119995874 isoform X2 [Tripterygium wilfordii]|uniref:uncharacterized protein LOC119995874 isoform X2 n=1 Tax=Tripterygium wilfordii TaxID=458696 RepID=UPI0018F8639D|nr:uncharacterized protein LOC119995874 isoform X2 [Tripterygium wilfordii]